MEMFSAMSVIQPRDDMVHQTQSATSVSSSFNASLAYAVVENSTKATRRSVRLILTETSPLPNLHVTVIE